MDDKTKADIDAGVPMVIVHWDEMARPPRKRHTTWKISLCPIGRKSN